MFDIGWSEMAVVALIALLIIGPKDLPKVMRSAAHWARKARGLAREFQSGVDDMIRDADLEDARKAVTSARSLDVRKAIGDTLDPTGDMRGEVSDIEKSARDTVAAGESGDGTDDGDDEVVAKDVADPKVDPKVDPETDAEAEPNIAPPHSLTPPEDSPETPPTLEPPTPEPPTPEPPNPETAGQPTADDSADKRAS